MNKQANENIIFEEGNILEGLKDQEPLMADYFRSEIEKLRLKRVPFRDAQQKEKKDLQAKQQKEREESRDRQRARRVDRKSKQHLGATINIDRVLAMKQQQQHEYELRQAFESIMKESVKENISTIEDHEKLMQFEKLMQEGEVKRNDREYNMLRLTKELDDLTTWYFQQPDFDEKELLNQQSHLINDFTKKHGVSYKPIMDILLDQQQKQKQAVQSKFYADIRDVQDAAVQAMELRKYVGNILEKKPVDVTLEDIQLYIRSDNREEIDALLGARVPTAAVSAALIGISTVSTGGAGFIPAATQVGKSYLPFILGSGGKVALSKTLGKESTITEASHRVIDGVQTAVNVKSAATAMYTTAAGVGQAGATIYSVAQTVYDQAGNVIDITQKFVHATDNGNGNIQQHDMSRPPPSGNNNNNNNNNGGSDAGPQPPVYTFSLDESKLEFPSEMNLRSENSMQGVGSAHFEERFRNVASVTGFAKGVANERISQLQNVRDAQNAAKQAEYNKVYEKQYKTYVDERNRWEKQQQQPKEQQQQPKEQQQQAGRAFDFSMNTVSFLTGGVYATRKAADWAENWFIDPLIETVSPSALVAKSIISEGLSDADLVQLISPELRPQFMTVLNAGARVGMSVADILRYTSSHELALSTDRDTAATIKTQLKQLRESNNNNNNDAETQTFFHQLSDDLGATKIREVDSNGNVKFHDTHVNVAALAKIRFEQKLQDEATAYISRETVDKLRYMADITEGSLTASPAHALLESERDPMEALRILSLGKTLNDVFK